MHLDKVSKTGVSTACFSCRFTVSLDNMLTQQLNKSLNVKLKFRRKSLVP